MYFSSMFGFDAYVQNIQFLGRFVCGLVLIFGRFAMYLLYLLELYCRLK